MRRLIINADDFGLTAGINSAILKAHFEGIVTSATLMANGSAFDQAVSLTASAPSLSIGCHVMLVDGSSLLQPASSRRTSQSGRRPTLEDTRDRHDDPYGGGRGDNPPDSREDAS